ncbi:MAG: DUF5336 domain-containing protein [Gordonia sp. (in: high G+C Gram-positive bacteria)]|uniref:DUF5336 domain-containing protein n=1 Tax=Gordonia sp. (in: high G+C Gram-positive bacteria) TaxID=84139 RepID=UPI003BB53078
MTYPQGPGYGQGDSGQGQGQGQYGQYGAPAPQYGQPAPQYGQQAPSQYGQQPQQQYGAPAQYSAPKPPSQGLPHNTAQILALVVGGLGVITLFGGFLAGYKGGNEYVGTITVKLFATAFATPWALVAVAGVAALLTLLVGSSKHYAAAVASLSVVAGFATIFQFASTDAETGAGAIVLLITSILSAIVAVGWVLVESEQIKVAPAPVAGVTSAGLGGYAAPVAPSYGGSAYEAPATPSYEAPSYAAPSYETPSYEAPATPSYGGSEAATSYTPSHSASESATTYTPLPDTGDSAVDAGSATTVFGTPTSDDEKK